MSLETLDLLWTIDKDAYKRLIETGEIKITKWLSEKTWLEVWTYTQWSKWFTSVFKKLQKEEPSIFNSLMDWMTKWDWNKKWYSFIAPKGMTDEEFVLKLNNFFWKDIAINKLNQATNRWTIATQVEAQDSIISIKYWEQWGKIRYYIWVWSKIKDKWFDLRNKWWVFFHEESADIIRNILRQEDIESWIKHALPLHNVDSGKVFNEAAMDKFIDRALLNFQKDKEYWTTLNWKVVDTEMWWEIRELIKKEFKYTEEDTSSMSRYVFEVFTLKVLDNLPLYKVLYKDLDKIRQWADAWDNLVKLEDLNKLLDSFANTTNIQWWNKAFTKQFNKSAYKKQAEKKYDNEQARIVAYINDAETRLSQLKAQTPLEWWKKYIDEQIARLEEDILAKKTRQNISRSDYTEAYINVLFNDSFETYLRWHMLWKLNMLSDVPTNKYKSAIDTKISTNKIDEIEVKIDKNPITVKKSLLKQIEILKKEIEDIKIADASKKVDIIEWKPSPETILEYKDELVLLKKELDEINNLSQEEKAFNKEVLSKFQV